MYEDYLERQPYVAYLVASRQSLIVSKEMMLRQIGHLEHARGICTKYFNMTRVRHFLERHLDSVTKFIHEFKLIEMLDEKSRYLDNYLDQTSVQCERGRTSCVVRALTGVQLLIQGKALTTVCRPPPSLCPQIRRDGVGPDLVCRNP